MLTESVYLLIAIKLKGPGRVGHTEPSPVHINFLLLEARAALPRVKITYVWAVETSYKRLQATGFDASEHV